MLFPLVGMTCSRRRRYHLINLSLSIYRYEHIYLIIISRRCCCCCCSIHGLPTRIFASHRLSMKIFDRSLGTFGFLLQYLTTVIPFDRDHPTYLTVEHLQSLNKSLLIFCWYSIRHRSSFVLVLQAINDDSRQVPELLTKYILTVLCPCWPSLSLLVTLNHLSLCVCLCAFVLWWFFLCMMFETFVFVFYHRRARLSALSSMSSEYSDILHWPVLQIKLVYANLFFFLQDIYSSLLFSMSFLFFSRSLSVWLINELSIFYSRLRTRLYLGILSK